LKYDLDLVHRKKRFTIFPSPAGMSLTKLPLGRNNSVMTSLFPPRESLVLTSRLGTGKSRTFFVRCTHTYPQYHHHPTRFIFLPIFSTKIKRIFWGCFTQYDNCFPRLDGSTNIAASYIDFVKSIEHFPSIWQASIKS
jgi:hypothetical protein